ncbi:hypothetical protein N752_31270 [Desulforamulus aquiferis]|nr:hypothetical protein [Desulforamulus aquiferis]RYD01234.1 hypothetical protein N752_31270 [Desulforamulus aquiferis]
MEFNLHQFHEGIKKDSIIFCYSGPISQATVEGIGKTLKLNMEIEEADFGTSQSVFSILLSKCKTYLIIQPKNCNSKVLTTGN